MTVKVVEPLSIRSNDIVPNLIGMSEIYYLGYGRNAWNATWANKYYPNCISFDKAELAVSAERMRVQGSVFKIQSLPLILINDGNLFGICPINDRSQYEYNRIMKRFDLFAPDKFWHALPYREENWLLALFFDEPITLKKGFSPYAIKSASSGPKYYLNWYQEQAEWYVNFLKFAEDFANYMKKLIEKRQHEDFVKSSGHAPKGS
jgi:hypothetical protein